jgi:hypothetical protein
MTLAELFTNPIKFFDDAVSILRFGTGRKITWKAGEGFSGGDGERLLKRYHVTVYNRQVSEKGSDYGITVKEKQKVWAEYLLLRSGFPLTSEIDRKNIGTLPGPMPRPFQKKGSKPRDLFGKVSEFLGG